MSIELELVAEKVESISEIYAAAVAEMEAQGYESTSRADSVQDHYHRMIDSLYRRYGVAHPRWKDLIVTQPNTQWSTRIDMCPQGKIVDGMCSQCGLVNAHKHKAVLVNGYWAPRWIFILVQCERAWRKRVSLLGTAEPSVHEEVMEVLHAGLSGDLEKVEIFIGMQQLASELDEPKFTLWKPDMNARAYNTLDELRQAQGLPPL